MNTAGNQRKMGSSKHSHQARQGIDIDDIECGKDETKTINPTR